MTMLTKLTLAIASLAFFSCSLQATTIGIATGASREEMDALIITLHSLGQRVVIDPVDFSNIDLFISYPGSLTNRVPLVPDIMLGTNYIQISDWGSAAIPNSVYAVPNLAPVTVKLNQAHSITSGLPSTWTTHGFWRYGFAPYDYEGYSTNIEAPDLVDITVPIGASRALTAKELGFGRMVYIGWNVYGPDAGASDLKLLEQSIEWATTGAVDDGKIAGENPEPATIFIIGGGLIAFAVFGRRIKLLQR
jgi:hypothetical protein